MSEREERFTSGHSTTMLFILCILFKCMLHPSRIRKKMLIYLQNSQWYFVKISTANIGILYATIFILLPKSRVSFWVNLQFIWLWTLLRKTHQCIPPIFRSISFLIFVKGKTICPKALEHTDDYQYPYVLTCIVRLVIIFQVHNSEKLSNITEVM